MKPVAIGVIRTSHGVGGAVKVFSLSGETTHFFALTEVELRHGAQRSQVSIDWCRSHGDALLLKFVGVDTPEAAKRLSGAEIWVDRQAAAPLHTNEHYVSDLVGLRVVAVRGESLDGYPVVGDGSRAQADLGTVEAVYDGAQAPLLSIRTANGMRLVPFMQQFVGTVDLVSGTVELTAPWILDFE